MLTLKSALISPISSRSVSSRRSISSNRSWIARRSLRTSSGKETICLSVTHFHDAFRRHKFVDIVSTSVKSLRWRPVFAVIVPCRATTGVQPAKSGGQPPVLRQNASIEAGTQSYGMSLWHPRYIGHQDHRASRRSMRRLHGDVGAARQCFERGRLRFDARQRSAICTVHVGRAFLEAWWSPKTQ